MMVNTPTARSRFGAEVRRLRRKAGISQEQLARTIVLSQSMLSGIELGQKSAKEDQAAAIDRALTASGRLKGLWDSLNSDTSYPDWFRHVVTLERKAIEIREYQMAVLPGLVQTERYARAVIGPAQPWASESKVEGLVQARVKRGKVFSADERPLVWFVVDELVIRRPIGGPEVMKEQLDHVLHLLTKQVIRLQVMPESRLAHPGLSGPFRVMHFADHPPMAYPEHTLGGVILDDESTVRQCSALFSALQAEALSPGESTELIQSRREQL